MVRIGVTLEAAVIAWVMTAGGRIRPALKIDDDVSRYVVAVTLGALARPRALVVVTIGTVLTTWGTAARRGPDRYALPGGHRSPAVRSEGLCALGGGGSSSWWRSWGCLRGP